MERIRMKEFNTSAELENFLNRVSFNMIIKIFASKNYYGVLYRVKF